MRSPAVATSSTPRRSRPATRRASTSARAASAVRRAQRARLRGQARSPPSTTAVGTAASTAADIAGASLTHGVPATAATGRARSAPAGGDGRPQQDGRTGGGHHGRGVATRSGEHLAADGEAGAGEQRLQQGSAAHDRGAEAGGEHGGGHQGPGDDAGAGQGGGE